MTFHVIRLYNGINNKISVYLNVAAVNRTESKCQAIIFTKTYWQWNYLNISSINTNYPDENKAEINPEM